MMMICVVGHGVFVFVTINILCLGFVVNAINIIVNIVIVIIAIVNIVIVNVINNRKPL